MEPDKDYLQRQRHDQLQAWSIEFECWIELDEIKELKNKMCVQIVQCGHG